MVKVFPPEQFALETIEEDRTIPHTRHPIERMRDMRREHNRNRSHVPFRTRLRNCLKWCACLIHVPIFYATLPLQLCFITPCVRFAFEEEVAVAINGGENDVQCVDVFALNLSGAIVGIASLPTALCCCFGCAGSFSPASF